MIPWGDGYITTLAPNAYNRNIKWELLKLSTLVWTSVFLVDVLMVM